MQSLRPLLSMLGWLVLALAMTASPALAHAVLLSTSPSDGQVLASAPAEVVLTFNEPVSPIAAQLIGPDNASTPVVPEAIGARVHLKLPAELGRGTHLISYRVVSTDGHPIGGTLLFAVGEASGSPNASASSDPLLAGTIIVVRALLYGAMMFGSGGLVFGLFGPLPVAAKRLSLGLSVIGLWLLPVALGLQGLDALGQPISGLFSAEAFAAGAATSYGATLAALALCFMLSIIALLLTGQARSFLAVLALAAAAIAPALSGHASAASPQWLTRPAVGGHVLALLFWLGSLVPLALSLRVGGAQAAASLRRFSAAIPYAVLLLLGSGTVLTVVQLGPPSPAWLTAYAAILASKLTLVALLFGLALWNRFRLTGPSLGGDAVAATKLRRSIRLEVIVALCILGLVAGWRVTPPPRALAALEMRPVETMLMDERTMVDLRVVPGRAGPVTLHLEVTDAEGAPVTPLSVTVLLAQPERGIEPISRPAIAGEDGWQVEGLTLPPGLWSVTVEVRIDTFTLARLSGELTIDPVP